MLQILMYLRLANQSVRVGPVSSFWDDLSNVEQSNDSETEGKASSTMQMGKNGRPGSMEKLTKYAR